MSERCGDDLDEPSQEIVKTNRLSGEEIIIVMVGFKDACNNLHSSWSFWCMSHKKIVGYCYCKIGW